MCCLYRLSVSVRRPPSLLPTKGPPPPGEWGPSDAAKSGVIHTYAGRKESRSGVHEANQRLPASIRPERGDVRGAPKGGVAYAAVRCIGLKETIAGCTDACLGRRACCRLAWYGCNALPNSKYCISSYHLVSNASEMPFGRMTPNLELNRCGIQHNLLTTCSPNLTRADKNSWCLSAGH